MKLYDAKGIIPGLVIFVVIFTFPLWFAAGKAGPAPDPVRPPKTVAKACVESTDYMKKNHMQLLDVWRDMAVRDGKRIYVASSGKRYTISLSNNCMKCHTSKAKFCDRCHNYAGVTPYCWSCHIQPKEAK